MECELCFSDSNGRVTWKGKRVCNRNEFDDYLRGPVQSRLRDVAHLNSVESDLRALATTNMASDTLAQLLLSEPDRKPWEIGEALAECLLEENCNVKWPWNTERDKRTPKASLPGADLVGFVERSNTTLLVLGEVKTSNDSNHPPNTMYGQNSMINQLDGLVDNIKIHMSLIRWLHIRCKNTDLWPLFESAIRQYLESNGRALLLFGMLMRDTNPNELDLRNRARTLSQNVEAPTRVELNAWYLPIPIEDWHSSMEGGRV